ncbi:lipoprotein [Spiroplasma cantharicola]|uniref:MOLPALP family lipoprotein n=1 Tax=Spiroplasma cantharicola TaxID=362837 RepID=A0A0M4KEB1_9MOLU|nr:lipoprotein [Spiroplasma cantharicola]ALD66282.1 hypothetical protein SCANT_v1c03720 [Spiroplasma cantharicola]
MKKLLAIFGTSLLVVSPAFLVVSCTKKEKNIDDISLKTAVEQIGKSVYLTDTKKYNFNYQMNDILRTKRIKDISTIYGNDTYTKDDLSSYSRFDDLYNYYFDKNLFADNLSISENINWEGNIQAQNSKNLELLLVTIPNLLDLLGNGKIFTFIFKLIEIAPSILVSLSDNYLVSYLNKILSKENSESFSNAFSNEPYTNFTNQEALNSSIIGLSNSIDFLLGNKNELKIPTKEQSQGEYFLNSISLLTNNLRSILKKEKTINLDLIIDLPAIAEVIRFARTLIVYITNGVDSIYKENQNQSGHNYFEEIEKFRNSVIEAKKNELNILNVFEFLDSTYEDGEGLKLIFALLFQSYKEPKLRAGKLTINVGAISDENIQVKGITPLLQASINAVFPTFYITEGLPSIVVSLLKILKIDKVNLASVTIDLLNSLVSGSNFKGIIDIMNHFLIINFIKNEQLKSKIESLKEIDEIYKNSLWTELYGGTFINKFYEVLFNKKIEEKINIKGILENSKISFLGEKILYKDILSKINNNQDFKGDFKIDFSNISQIVIDLRKILDLKNGIKTDINIKDFQSNLETLFVNLQGMKKLTSWASNTETSEGSSLWDKYQAEQNKYNKNLRADILTQKIKSVNQNKKYSYEVIVENKKYVINLKMLKNNKFQIISIN